MGPLLDAKAERLARACLALEGLSVGDAFGERFFVSPDTVGDLIRARALPAAPWPHTDDTQMALSVLESLRQFGRVEQDALAQSLAHHYDPSRGYGPSMHGLLEWVRLGIPWRAAAGRLFAGQGSYGNGAAMRVAPVGAYFAENLDEAAKEAVRSAEVTHAHAEGIAGAVAVAVAAALACKLAREGRRPSRREYLDGVLPYVPSGLVRERLRHARDLAEGASVRLAVSALGNGTGVSAQDTVPFALWCAGERLESYEEALWLTVSGLGDRDTTCAIVGGIVALYGGRGAIPESWLAAREPLPEWPFRDEADKRE